FITSSGRCQKRDAADVSRRVRGCAGMVAAIASRAGRMSREEAMKTKYTVGLSILAGVVVGAAVVEALHAQATPPAYVIAELDVANVEAFDKEYVPPAAKAVIDGGGKYLVRGGETAAFFGEPPKRRNLIMVFDSMDKAKAAFNSPAYREAKKIGDKYA